jgi:outer membrane protein assembly factor BamA
MTTRCVLVTALAVPLVVCAAEARAQDEWPELHVSGAAPVIDEVAFIGARRVAAGALRPQISSQAGETLDSARIAKDVRTLGRLGWFASVRAEERSVAAPVNGLEDVSHRVRLNFYLEENPFLSGVEFAGSRLLARAQITKLLADQKIEARLGEPENPVTSQRIAKSIEAALAELGHPEARVQIRRTESDNSTVR